MKSQAMRLSILIVEDESPLQGALRRFFTQLGHRVMVASSVAEAQQVLQAPVDFCLVDFHLPDGHGSEFVRWGFSQNLLKRVYCMTGFASRKDVADVIRAGCIDVIEKPFSLMDVKALLTAGVGELRDELSAWRQQFAPEIIGEDESMQEVLKTLSRVASSECAVMVTGESGTGKELIAQSLHRASRRSRGPFIALNCAAIPEHLLESELFGHARGAFTGANNAREGHLMAANGGTLFLDEIGELPLSAQAKLLRAIQERCVTPVGTERSIPIDLRIVTATNCDLEEMIEQRLFRSDLYYRLNVIHIELPPLRERHDDILPLAEYYLRSFNAKFEHRLVGFDLSATDALRSYSWPGNIREMINCIQRGVLLRQDGLLTAADLKLSTRQRFMTPPLGYAIVQPGQNTAASGPLPAPQRQGYYHFTPPQGNPIVAVQAPAPQEFQADGSDNLNLREALDDVEKRLIMTALDRSNGNRTEAAALLGLNRTTLVEKLRRLVG
jgi:DNA-binding NtrC family response regulator